MKLRHYIAFIPLFLFVTIEVHQAVLWYTLQIQKEQRSGYYKPKKEHLPSIYVGSQNELKALSWISKNEIHYQNAYFKVWYMDRDQNGFRLYLEKDIYAQQIKDQLQKQKKKEKENKIRSLKKHVLSPISKMEIEFSVQESEKTNNFSKLLRFYRIELNNGNPPPEVCA